MRILIVVSLGIVLVAIIQVAFWYAYARENEQVYAWPALIARHLDRAEVQAHLPSCIAIEPELYARTPVHLRERIGRLLSSKQVELRVAPPTRGPSTGYLDRECVEVFVESERNSSYPFLSVVHVSYYTYDYNGDAVLLVQLGSRWIDVASWSAWF